MQVTEHIHALKIPFTITVSPTIVLERFVYVNLICGETITLIDTGVAGSREIIFDYLKSIDRGPEEISRILLTHSHPDHLGAAKSIQDALGCPTMIHAAERPWAEDVDHQFQERPVPGFHDLVEGSVAIDHTFADGDTIPLGKDLTLHVIHTPGHSKGSTSFLLQEDKALFCGDAILLPGQMPILEDLTKSINSLEKLRTIPDVEVLLASWDLPQKGPRIAEIMNESLNWLTHIRKTAKAVDAENPTTDPTEFCKATLNVLNLPESMANPLVTKSLQSALKS